MLKRYIAVLVVLILALFTFSGCDTIKKNNTNISADELDNLIDIAYIAANSRSNGISDEDLAKIESAFEKQAYEKFMQYNTFKYDSNNGFINLEEQIALQLEKANMYAPEESESKLTQEEIDALQQEIDNKLQDEKMQEWMEKTYPGYKKQTDEQSTTNDEIEESSSDTTVENEENGQIEDNTDSNSENTREKITDIELDERIIEKDGVRGVYRKDLYFMDGIATVKIGDEYVEIYEAEHLATEDEVRNNPSYKFELTNYGGYDNGLIKATFQTIENSTIDNYEMYIMNVYMYIVDGKISTYEQRMVRI